MLTSGGIGPTPEKLRELREATHDQGVRVLAAVLERERGRLEGRMTTLFALGVTDPMAVAEHAAESRKNPSSLRIIAPGSAVPRTDLARIRPSVEATAAVTGSARSGSNTGVSALGVPPVQQRERSHAGHLFEGSCFLKDAVGDTLTLVEDAQEQMLRADVVVS